MAATNLSDICVNSALNWKRPKRPYLIRTVSQKRTKNKKRKKNIWRRPITVYLLEGEGQLYEDVGHYQRQLSRATDFVHALRSCSRLDVRQRGKSIQALHHVTFLQVTIGTVRLILVKSASLRVPRQSLFAVRNFGILPQFLFWTTSYCHTRLFRYYLFIFLYPLSLFRPSSLLPFLLFLLTDDNVIPRRVLTTTQNEICTKFDQ